MFNTTVGCNTKTKMTEVEKTMLSRMSGLNARYLREPIASYSYEEFCLLVAIFKKAELVSETAATAEITAKEWQEIMHYDTEGLICGAEELAWDELKRISTVLMDKFPRFEYSAGEEVEDGAFMFHRNVLDLYYMAESEMRMKIRLSVYNLAPLFKREVNEDEQNCADE